MRRAHISASSLISGTLSEKGNDVTILRRTNCINVVYAIVSELSSTLSVLADSFGILLEVFLVTLFSQLDLSIDLGSEEIIRVFLRNKAMPFIQFSFINYLSKKGRKHLAKTRMRAMSNECCQTAARPEVPQHFEFYNIDRPHMEFNFVL